MWTQPTCLPLIPPNTAESCLRRMVALFCENLYRPHVGGTFVPKITSRVWNFIVHKVIILTLRGFFTRVSFVSAGDGVSSSSFSLFIWDWFHNGYWLIAGRKHRKTFVKLRRTRALEIYFPFFSFSGRASESRVACGSGSHCRHGQALPHPKQRWRFAAWTLVQPPCSVGWLKTRMLGALCWALLCWADQNSCQRLAN